ncbi:WhiB family transcriptional regulator [Kitasatospora fiedleri]|uniref:WhiB family transcriptional regulator n=1 Tax=Kitasatospora fiedleri TaxID=2991545 RepID=UPI00249C5E06|nr:WhiB family transcriptional regulator [Kitasatospora fiedleri]
MTKASRLPGAQTHHWDWQLEGSCRTVGSEVFFRPANEGRAEAREREQAAKRVCGGCPVRLECRRYALATREPYGVWGGLTEDERRALLVRREPAAARVTPAAARVTPVAA